MGTGLEGRFERYCDTIKDSLMHADREQPARWYLKGLMLPGDRKSVEPMAARVHPENVRAAHQSMHHLVAEAPWSDEAALAAGHPRGVVLADAAYGDETAWRENLVAHGLMYAVGIRPGTTVWWGDHQPRVVPTPPGRRGRPRRRASADHGGGSGTCTAFAGVAYGDVAQRDVPATEFTFRAGALSSGP